ncbi:unnamed protein product [Rotaria magnacalcarata]|uniref:WASH1 WAHD domain-containing protein n=1 Tax=Rotaria magnacalcarata TaxID=392030 RepID=A0A816FYH2_9BILA|nr:unnamed protein product [Rotaria magnacalcarata]CAF1667351.1 unnamed protein product [Rotaria magnacalcarata]CAF2080031.1 unnamed protein product [Rotaria magnacalcarata]CAF2135320.1 unnamed protein product [Rotaria magnacalcarata]CAF2153012.1 unnamed protein product [Rotaria magnacalcarata]
MTATHPYTIPVISGDLRRAEFVKQLADTFDYMDTVSQDMFNRIAIRLNIYRAQLNKFDERIQHANAHIDRIKGSKRAIQVHSSARYPVEQNRSTYKSIFECDTDNEDNRPPVLHYNLFRLNETNDKFIDRNDKESKSKDDTLVVLKQYDDNFIQKTKRNILHGLGKPPTNIKSVVSFLKYNTSENPYTQPTKIDPLNVGGRMRKQADEPTQPRIVETPLPAFYSQRSERPKIGDFGYNPTLGIVPQLSLPDNLPELDNYATFDENTTNDWSGQQMTSIAPSYAISMLPDINDLSSSATTTTLPPVEPPRTTVLAPPPVDIPAIIPLTSTSNTVPPPAPPLPPLAPPLSSTVPSLLTPPPPPSLAATESQVSANNEVNNNGDDNDDDDGGNAFLAEIRNFSKANKLKAASKSNPVDAAPLPPSHEQENIMDTLKKRLMQRRGFITGESAPSSTAVEKPIPAPPAPPPVTGGAFTDAIADKAKQIAAEKLRQANNSDDDDNDNEDDWE